MRDGGDPTLKINQQPCPDRIFGEPHEAHWWTDYETRYNFRFFCQPDKPKRVKAKQVPGVDPWGLAANA